jgi:iron complex transport system substrate-binding protein
MTVDGVEFGRGSNLAREHYSPFSAFICATSAFICVFTAFFPTQSTAAPISLTDDLGRKVELKEPAKRIVTLAPFLTELVFAAGAGDRVVGVSAYSDYPPEAGKLPVVSSAAGFSLERIAALEPDLVLAWKDSMRIEDIERISRFGAAVFVVQSRRLDDVPRVLRIVGSLTAIDVGPLTRRFDARVADLRRAHAGRRKVKAFLEIWNRPLTTISGHHFMNESLEICGAQNVFESLEGVAPVVSWEQVYAADPEVIVGAGSAGDATAFREQWKERATLSAVRTGRMVYVNPDRIQRLTLRTPDGIAELCEGIERVRNK